MADYRPLHYFNKHTERKAIYKEKQKRKMEMNWERKATVWKAAGRFNHFNRKEGSPSNLTVFKDIYKKRGREREKIVRASEMTQR